MPEAVEMTVLIRRTRITNFVKIYLQKGKSQLLLESHLTPYPNKTTHNRNHADKCVFLKKIHSKKKMSKIERIKEEQGKKLECRNM